VDAEIFGERFKGLSVFSVADDEDVDGVASIL